MGYEVFLLAVPDGADVEEAGEALLVRMARGHERASAVGPARKRSERLAEQMLAAEPGLAAAPDELPAVPGSIELRAASGLQVAVAERFARFLVPFVCDGETAPIAFHQLFALLAVAAAATGWRPYDPQEGEAVAIDDTSCDAALEVYLSVMDQLGTTGPAGAVSA